MSGKRILMCTMGGLVSLVWAGQADAQITVNCGAGQTISGALAALGPSNTTVVFKCFRHLPRESDDPAQ